MLEAGIYLIVFAGILLWYYSIAKPDAVIPFDEVHPSYMEEYGALFEQKMPYFRKLKPDARHHFIYRVREVERELTVIGREELEVTPSMKRMVCACIVQLTFGFKDPHLPMLSAVALYPDVFYSRLLETWVRGLTMGNGMVHMSWKHFEEGYADSEDTYNLGLHEFAHVLRLQAEKTNQSDSRMEAYFYHWEEIGNEVYAKLRNGQVDFLREYAATNSSEFFAVCIENFFEVPQKLMGHLPDLYFHLCHLLNQNPLNAGEHYSFDREDAEQANTILEEAIPLFQPQHSANERIFWTIAGNASLLGLSAVYLNISDIHMDLVPAVRTALVSGMIMLGVRWHYYADVRAITDTDFLVHFLSKVMPVVGLLTFIVHLMYC